MHIVSNLTTKLLISWSTLVDTSTPNIDEEMFTRILKELTAPEREIRRKDACRNCVAEIFKSFHMYNLQTCGYFITLSLLLRLLRLKSLKVQRASGSFQRTFPPENFSAHLELHRENLAGCAAGGVCSLRRGGSSPFLSTPHLVSRQDLIHGLMNRRYDLFRRTNVITPCGL